MNGMDVFGFAVSRAPKSVKKLLEHFRLDTPPETVLLLHQANRLIDEKIRKKLGFPEERCPSALERFGNTSCASIPLLMVSERERVDWGGARLSPADSASDSPSARSSPASLRTSPFPSCSKSESAGENR